MKIAKKVKMGLIKIKDFNLDKPDELLCILTEESLSPVQKRMFDYFLWNAKQMIIKENIKEIDNFLKVYISLDELYAVIGFSRNKNKKIAYLINKLKKLKNIDIIKINLIKEPTVYNPKKIGFLNDIEDDEIDEVDLTSTIGGFKILNKQRLVRIYLSPTIAEYLIKSNSYTKLNFLVYSFLRSTYAINLYNYLLNKYQSQKALMEKGVIPKSDIVTTEKIEVKKLLDILEVPPTHKGRKEFRVFNDKILSKAVEKLNKEDAVEFEIIRVKKEKLGKKVNKISFELRKKKNSKIVVFDKTHNEILKIDYDDYCLLEKTEDKTEKTPLEEKKEDILSVLREKIISKKLPFVSFVRELQKLQDIEITNVLPNNRGKTLKINSLGMLELDGEELDNARANAIRRTLYQNPDLIGRVEDVDVEFEKLKEKSIGKVLVFKKDKLYYAIGIKALEKKDDERLLIKGDELLRNIRDFEIKALIEWFKKQKLRDELKALDKEDYINNNLEIEMEELEDFFQKNKDSFQKWLDEVEKRSFEISDAMINLDENNDEYEKLAKEMEILDFYLVKGYDVLNGENINALDKKMVLKKFKEWKEKNQSA